jgi:hypothetical protein
MTKADEDEDARVRAMIAPEHEPAWRDDGAPLCDEAHCGRFDGKRCRLTGFRPSEFCEPAIVEMASELRLLRKLVERPGPAGVEARKRWK